MENREKGSNTPKFCFFSSVPLGLGIERASTPQPRSLVLGAGQLGWEERGCDARGQSRGSIPEANSPITGSSPGNKENRHTEGLLRGKGFGQQG